MKKYKSVTLIVLDGWGLSPSWGGNALVMNNPKNIDRLWKTYPHTILQALGSISYGNIVGESRLGHLMLGAGRDVMGFHAQIGEEIKNRNFYKNKVLLSAIEWARKNNSNIHFMGMMSAGGVHSDVDHLLALLDLARKENFSRVCIDLITDGIDSSPTEALSFVEKIKNKINTNKIGLFSSIGGRDFAMDRDENWDKTRKYFETLIGENKVTYKSADEAISQNYRDNKTDNFLEPGLILNNNKTCPIKDNDAVVFFNFREDRAIQITKFFLDPNFKLFLWKPKKINNLFFATFIEYAKNLPAKVVFLKKYYPETLSQVISEANAQQLKLAESEKKTHVTLFFNGGREELFAGEEVKIISSPRVNSYDQKPEMSAESITNIACDAIKSNKYEFILINYANVDMVAHTGNIIAVGKAVQVLDEQVNRIVEANLVNDNITIITADHGNAEQMINVSTQPVNERETLHTLNPVPFILVAKDMKKNLVQTSVSMPSNALSKIISAKETLADVAPTILELLGLPKPKEMTGHSLINRLG